MLIEKLWMNNPLRNYNYIVACPDSGEAMAIDPLDADRVLEAATAKRRGWTIKQVLNTHEHGDHIAGNQQLVRETGATLLAPAPAAASGVIPSVDTPLSEGDTVTVGTSVTLDVLETPGHTMCHISLLSRTDPPHLFCGDTVFNAGAGNCHNGGDAATLYRTFAEKIFKLPGNTFIYPGHEYFDANLKFTLDLEPGNDVADKILKTLQKDADKPHPLELDRLIDAHIQNQDPADPLVCTTLDMERQHNVFFRLDNEEIIANLRKKFPGMSNAPGAEEVFLKLRQLRNNW